MTWSRSRPRTAALPPYQLDDLLGRPLARPLAEDEAIRADGVSGHAAGDVVVVRSRRYLTAARGQSGVTAAPHASGAVRRNRRQALSSLA